MNIKIRSTGGTPWRTQITDDAGNPIPDVRAATIKLAVDDINRVELDCYAGPVEVDAEMTTCPFCKHDMPEDVAAEQEVEACK